MSENLSFIIISMVFFLKKERKNKDWLLLLLFFWLASKESIFAGRLSLCQVPVSLVNEIILGHSALSGKGGFRGRSAGDVQAAIKS